ncbi:MAG: ATP-dependent Clp protease adaptor protein ClpS [Candidatus Magnetoglobus multicellularis str. Araruama]|uniref:ATP-dependent Clp protease adapter protein ClpS n=1 Tax=Candidatus Magnetoglobus multicellularis str. Araruama TaxID=890399 RepID=A0A1V1P4R3_9BACT|nr:MAG: ATP-dependent Clp protease adaptor protein ClpS [Candidatus Magnetoglobus multicellularis str. Araruama]
MEWEESTDVVEDTDTDSKEEIVEPRLYKVIMHNDHYTTMEFVVYVLETVFHKSLDEAMTTMLSVHNKGSGICGVYTAEVAETKIYKVHQMARAQEFPLKCTMEEE